MSAWSFILLFIPLFIREPKTRDSSSSSCLLLPFPFSFISSLSLCWREILSDWKRTLKARRPNPLAFPSLLTVHPGFILNPRRVREFHSFISKTNKMMTQLESMSEIQSRFCTNSTCVWGWVLCTPFLDNPVMITRRDFLKQGMNLNVTMSSWSFCAFSYNRTHIYSNSMSHRKTRDW